MAGAGLLSKLAKRTRSANRAIDKALSPAAKLELLNKGQTRIRRATEGQGVTRNVGERSRVAGMGRGRKQGAVGTLGAGAVGVGLAMTKEAAMAPSDDKKPKPAAKKKPAPKPTVKKKSAPKPAPKPAAKNGRVNPSDYPIYNKDTKSGKAFRAAFKAAVKARKKTFRFEGRSYSTKKKK